MKKLIAILLAALMVLGMMTSAMAANGDSYNASKTDNVIHITKTLTANGTEAVYPSDTLKFTVSEGTVSNSTEGTTAPEFPAIADVTVAAGATSVDIPVTLPAFTTVGVYTYTITENDTNVAGVTYHTDQITLVLTVVEESGKKVIAAVHCEIPVDTNNANRKKTDEFENVYNAGSLTVSKTVSGNFADKDKAFSFKITFTAPANAEGSEVPFKSVNGSITKGTKESKKVVIAASGWANGKAEYEFTLKHGESLQLDNIPYGVTYRVEELEPYADNYNVDVADTEFVKNGEINTASTAEAFVNVKNTTPDTGIVLDSLPYVMIAVAVAAAVVLMSLKKRRIED